MKKFKEIFGDKRVVDLSDLWSYIMYGVSFYLMNYSDNIIMEVIGFTSLISTFITHIKREFGKFYISILKIINQYIKDKTHEK